MGMVSISDFFDSCIKAAIDARASDIHFSPEAPPRMRVNGVMIDMFDSLISKELTDALASYIMTRDERDNVIHYEPGDHDFAVSYKEFRFRGNTAKTRKGLVIALRFLPRAIPSMMELALPEKTLVSLLNRERGGIILVTGPTGSGKTTTLASIIDYLNNTRRGHIVTIEAPVEYEHVHKKCNIDQRELPVDSPSFSSALRAALRQDPDVIMVGEMRDLETISAAISAAETGHLVLSTLHTNSAAETINRIIDAFPAQQQSQIRVQLAGNLLAVLSQRLLPRSDQSGRVAAYELLITNTAVSAMIRENKTIQIASIMETSRKDGMVCFDNCLRDLVVRGIISRVDAMRYAVDQKNF